MNLVYIASFVLAFFVEEIEKYHFNISIALTALAFLIIGAIKGKVVGKHYVKSATETLVIGGIAALIAFFVGFFLRSLIG